MSTEPLTPFQKKAKRRLSHTRESARSRGKDFNLDRAYMENILLQTHCAYSGEKFGSGDDKLTLERWDNDKGYVKGNVVPVKLKYNLWRGDLSLKQLMAASGVADERLKNLDQPESFVVPKKAKEFHLTRLRVLKNVEGRKESLKNLEAASVIDEATMVRIETLKKRIASGTEEAARLLVLFEKEMNKAKEDPKAKVKTAKNAAQAYGIIATALLRFEYMNAHNYVRLKRGLPMIQKGE